MKLWAFALFLHLFIYFHVSRLITPFLLSIIFIFMLLVRFAVHQRENKMEFRSVKKSLNNKDEERWRREREKRIFSTKNNNNQSHFIHYFYLMRLKIRFFLLLFLIHNYFCATQTNINRRNESNVSSEEIVFNFHLKFKRNDYFRPMRMSAST